jgi:hypothetical protein
MRTQQNEVQRQSNTGRPSTFFARLYRDWCLAGALACVIAGFPSTPLGPLLLWAVILPGLAGWMVWQRPSAAPTRVSGALHAQLRGRPVPRQARRRRSSCEPRSGQVA